MNKENLLLYAITDRSWLKENETLKEAVKSALEGGATIIQLREKNLSYDEFLHTASELLPLCHSFGVKLIINDNVQICLEANADGVHLGQGDLNAYEARKILGDDKIIGVTAKTVEQAKKAFADGADYIGSGAVFGTSTKSDAKKMDIETLKSITASVDIPVVAIGGICIDNVEKLYGSGISGVAVVSGIFAQRDIKKAAQEILRKIQFLRR